jgi:hypothetical protein
VSAQVGIGQGNGAKMWERHYNASADVTIQPKVMRPAILGARARYGNSLVEFTEAKSSFTSNNESEAELFIGVGDRIDENNSFMAFSCAIGTTIQYDIQTEDPDLASQQWDKHDAESSMYGRADFMLYLPYTRLNLYYQQMLDVENAKKFGMTVSVNVPTINFDKNSRNYKKQKNNPKNFLYSELNTHFNVTPVGQLFNVKFGVGAIVWNAFKIGGFISASSFLAKDLLSNNNALTNQEASCIGIETTVRLNHR